VGTHGHEYVQNVVCERYKQPQSLLHHPLDTIQQYRTLPSQFPLSVLASSPRFRHSLSESFPLFSLFSSFSLRGLVCGTAFFGFALLTLGEAVFFCEGDDFLAAAVMDAREI
jgi:hypothetical protein